MELYHLEINSSIVTEVVDNTKEGGCLTRHRFNDHNILSSGISRYFFYRVQVHDQLMMSSVQVDA